MSAVVVRATASEAAGAGLRVAGLRVVDRAAKQLARSGHDVVVASDGACPVPPGVPIENADADALAAKLGGAPVVAADVVRPSNRGLEGGVRVTDAESRRAAEDAIFAELLRGDLGFVARYFNKPLSFRFTRHVLCKLPITPNQVTVGAGLVGAGGAVLIASGRPHLMLIGFLLAHLQSVLDGCDGELARVRFQQSAIGEWLDTVVDDALNVLLFAAVGVGLWRETGSTTALALGLGAAATMLVYSSVAYRELVRQGQGGEVLKVRWWFSRGGSLKERYGKERGFSPSRFLLTIGRRDFFLLAWVVFAALDLRTVVLVYVCILATVSGVAALGQLLIGPRREANPPGT